MSQSKERILVTSALPYANGPCHIGHIAGAYLPADIYVRYQRLRKRDVVYICGSDENGVPIMLRARAEGVSPKVIVDRYHEMIKESFARLGISFDYYGRTSSEVHHQTSQDFFRELAAKKVFKTKKEEQLYDPEAKLFLADRFVYGQCPVCKYENAYGDQCENCGSSLSPDDLINPRSAITDTEPVKKQTVHWYLPLADMQPKLEKWIENHPEWRNHVLGQIRSWFKDGLRDRAVTRDLPWGIPVPKDIAEQEGIDADGKVLYVWFDAPIGYISATKEWAIEQGEPERWREYWQDESSTLVHFIGKDNIVFHCLIFPAMLMTHGKYVLPENVPANEFLNLEGQKLSTSRNYAVWVHEYLENFEPDSLRYALAANMPEAKDTDFSWKEFQARHNNELADIIGNFVNRTLTFINKYYEGELPPAVNLDDLDKQMQSMIRQTRDEMASRIEKFQFREATRVLMDFGRFANKYFNDKAPWQSRKTDPEACGTSLNLCAQASYALAVLMYPVLPFSSEKLLRILNISSESALDWQAVGEHGLPAGHRFGETEIIFQKIEDKEIAKQISRLEGATAEQPKAVEKPETLAEIDIETFKQVDLRIANVLEAEKLKGADKLLKLKVDLGGEQRQVIAGIAKFYDPEKLVGKQVVLVANLKPAKLRGEMSQGMILAAETADGKLSLIAPELDLPAGAKVR